MSSNTRSGFVSIDECGMNVEGYGIKIQKELRSFDKKFLNCKLQYVASVTSNAFNRGIRLGTKEGEKSHQTFMFFIAYACEMNVNQSGIKIPKELKFGHMIFKL